MSTVRPHTVSPWAQRFSGVIGPWARVARGASQPSGSHGRASPSQGKDEAQTEKVLQGSQRAVVPLRSVVSGLSWSSGTVGPLALSFRGRVCPRIWLLPGHSRPHRPAPPLATATPRLGQRSLSGHRCFWIQLVPWRQSVFDLMINWTPTSP